MLVSSPPTGGIQVRPPQFNTGDLQLLTAQFEEFNYHLREQNKLLKNACKKPKKGKRRKKFFEKVGDAFCKALPVILTTVVTAVMTGHVKEPFIMKALRAA